jgi:hypothetical protein
MAKTCQEYNSIWIVKGNNQAYLDGYFAFYLVYKRKVKRKVVPVLNSLSAMPWRHSGEWRYSSTILDLGTRWRWVVSLTLQPLYPPGNRPRYPLDRRLGGSQCQSGRCGEEKHILPSKESNRDRLARSRLLYQLSNPNSLVYKVYRNNDIYLNASG